MPIELAEEPQTTEDGTDRSAEVERGAKAEDAAEITGEEEESQDQSLGERGEPPPEKETVPLATFLELKKEFKSFRETVAKDKGEIEGSLKKLQPPEKHPLDEWLESLPKGTPPTEEGGRGDAAYERRRNVEALLPILKDAAPHLIPQTKTYDAVLTGVIDRLYRLQFENEQLIGMVKGDPEWSKKLPAGLKHIDRIEAKRKELYASANRQVIPRHSDAFQHVLEEIRTEDEAQAARDKQIGDEAATHAVKEATQQRRTAGSPGNRAGAAPRGAVTPPRNTFERIRQGIEAGRDFLIP